MPSEWGTHVSVEAGEGLDHVEAVHVHNGSVDSQLRAVEWWLRTTQQPK